MFSDIITQLEVFKSEIVETVPDKHFLSFDALQRIGCQQQKRVSQQLKSIKRTAIHNVSFREAGRPYHVDCSRQVIMFSSNIIRLSIRLLLANKLINFFFSVFVIVHKVFLEVEPINRTKSAGHQSFPSPSFLNKILINMGRREETMKSEYVAVSTTRH